MVAQVIDHAFIASYEAAEGSERFRESTNDEVNIFVDTKLACSTTATFTDNAEGVGIIYQNLGVIFFCEGIHLVKLGNIPESTENAIGYDEFACIIGTLLEAFL